MGQMLDALARCQGSREPPGVSRTLSTAEAPQSRVVPADVTGIGAGHRLLIGERPVLTDASDRKRQGGIRAASGHGASYVTATSSTVAAVVPVFFTRTRWIASMVPPPKSAV